MMNENDVSDPESATVKKVVTDPPNNTATASVASDADTAPASDATQGSVEWMCH